MESNEKGPKKNDAEKSSKAMFLVMLGVIIAMIAAFLLLRPNPR